jgi:hypothetical protein
MFKTNKDKIVKNEHKPKSVVESAKRKTRSRGRPKKEVTSDEQIKALVTLDEKTKIENYANKLGLSVSSIIKLALIEKGVL